MVLLSDISFTDNVVHHNKNDLVWSDSIELVVVLFRWHNVSLFRIHLDRTFEKRPVELYLDEPVKCSYEPEVPSG